MALLMEMGGGVFADGIVAAPHVPALLAHPEVDPTHPGGEAFHTTGPARLDIGDGVEMAARRPRILHMPGIPGVLAVSDGPPGAESATDDPQRGSIYAGFRRAKVSERMGRGKCPSCHSPVPPSSCKKERMGTL